MKCMDFDVEYYELPDGTRPAEEFILEQDVKMRAKHYREDYYRREEK